MTINRIKCKTFEEGFWKTKWGCINIIEVENE